MDLILASASERRSELLKRLIEDFQIIVSDFDENSVLFHGDFESYVKEVSEGKAINILNIVKRPSIIIGCDTIVAYGNQVLGKPEDRNKAIETLKLLNGNVHHVYSAITIIDSNSGKIISECVKTEVKFTQLNDYEIFRYVDSGEPMDKAGSYGIQGYGGTFVEWINGCYYNVVGLPLSKLKFMLREMGVNL